MERGSKNYFFLALVLICVLSFSTSSQESLRGFAVASFSPLWQSLAGVKILLQAPFERFNPGEVSDEVKTKDQEIKRLLLENQMLGAEIERLKEVLEQEYSLVHQMLEEPEAKILSKENLTRHQKEVFDLFSLRLMNLAARVIYRPLNAWNSSLWVDKGEKDNRLLGRTVIAKNSPVVIGTTVVGVVDEVLESQSRVRLITDSGLNPSVRIKRGGWLLAKGEIKGESVPSLRSHKSRLLGVGFNYDFPDLEGPARDLRTGEPYEKNEKYPPIPLVQVGDLLITTGMDGVFPPGLQVGIVKKIYPLKEGDFAYDLEAESSAQNLNSLSVVFILPSA